MRALRRFSLGLTILMSVCTTVVFFSCKPLPPKEAPGPRNLTPGLSEALTAFATKQRYRGQYVLLEVLERSDSNDEAKSLADLIATAFEAGGWNVIRWKGSAYPVRGLRCHYHPAQREVADDLLSVFKNKGLRIEVLPIRIEGEPEGSSPEAQPQGLMLEVGLKQ